MESRFFFVYRFIQKMLPIEVARWTRPEYAHSLLPLCNGPCSIFAPLSLNRNDLTSLETQFAAKLLPTF